MVTASLRSFGIRSFDCAVVIGDALGVLPGVRKIVVEIVTRRVLVTFGPPTGIEDVRGALCGAGYPCATANGTGPPAAPPQPQGDPPGTDSDDHTTYDPA